MRKLNWGTKLGIMASIYVVGVLIFVGFSTTQKINLVSKDYYPKEIRYQEQIDKIRNALQMETQVQINQTGGDLQIKFPVSMKKAEGDITLYRPSDYESDVKYTIDLNDSGIQMVNTEQLLQGRYTVKIDWKYDGKEFYKEEAIYLSK